MDLKKSRRSVGLISAAVCLVAGLGLTGCGSSRDQAAGTPGAPAPTGSSAAVAGSTPTGAVRKSGGAATAAIPAKSKLPKLPKGVSTARPKDQIAPKATLVERNGKAAHPSVQVKHNAQPFSKPVAFTDGLDLKIKRMASSKMAGQGPGVFANRPVTHFYVSLSNGTKKALSLGAVVVSVTYGSPGRSAHLVYDEKSKDFSGSLKPGHSAAAVYGFSVPAADRARVTMTVDLDGIHQLAVFTGKVS